jgi:hypothetical protein
MKNISTFNKLFLLFCAALIVLLAFTVPHEKGENDRHHHESTAQRE